MAASSSSRGRVRGLRAAMGVVFISCNLHAAPEPVSVGAPPTAAIRQTWSESSPTVRIPKSLLAQLNLMGVVLTNYEAGRTFVLSKAFISTFLVTEAEATRVNRAIAKAQHDYRVVEGLHLEPATNAPDQSRLWTKRPPTVEEVNFRLRPFPKEAATIRWELQKEVVAALGEQRAELFWQYSFQMLKSVMDTFTLEEPAALGVRSLAIPGGNASRNAPGSANPSVPPLSRPNEQIFHTFFLRGAAPVPRIDMDETRWTQGPTGGGGGGSGGGPYGEELDEYVPESFRPTLARWRRAIREGTVPGALGIKAAPRNDPSPKEREAMGQLTAPKPGDPVFIHATWSDEAEDVELPKAFLTTAQVTVMTLDGQVTDDAAKLFSLDDAEKRAVNELYSEMERRVQQLELANLERAGTTGYALILRPFPDKKTELEAEWMKRLGERVGPGRAGFLDRAIRARVPFAARRQAPQGREEMMEMRRRAMAGPIWLLRGTNTVEIEISSGTGRSWELRYKSDNPADLGSGTLDWKKPPERFRHLLSPEVLESKLGLKQIPPVSK